MGLLRQVCFENFGCQNERIGTPRGGHVLGMPPLDLPMVVIHKVTQMVTKGVFLLQCTMKSPFSMYQEWFHSFEIGCK